MILSAIELIENVLFVNRSLYSNISWMRRRVAHSQNDELAEVYFEAGSDMAYGGVMNEFAIVARHLPPDSLKVYFGFDSSDRHFICPLCWEKCHREAWDRDWRFAQLVLPDLVTLHCAFCHESPDVLRGTCRGCGPSILSSEADTRGMCLVCARDESDF
jgi:hypothetical protein